MSEGKYGKILTIILGIVVETAGENSEFALIKLSELFNHADIQTTRRYLGLRTEELLETYDMLSF